MVTTSNKMPDNTKATLFLKEYLTCKEQMRMSKNCIVYNNH